MAYELGKGDECMLSGDFKSEGKERLAPAGAGRFADSCQCGWSDVESAHAKSVQRLSDFHDEVSKQRLRAYAPTEQDSYSPAEQTPFEFGHGHTFATTEPERLDIEKETPHKYACPRCGTGILVATECPQDLLI